jgi:phosphate transport system protein
MTHEVGTAVGYATRALLEADADIAERVISHDEYIDSERERIEELSFQLLALQQPVAGDLRMLVAALRMVSDLERMGDLSVHVAKIARMRVPESAVPTEMLPTIKRMAEVAEEMVRKVETVIADRDVQAALELERCDEEMDQLRRSSFRQMLSDDWAHGVEPAVDLALLGRYYERIADHAVSLARRVVFLVTGQHPGVVEPS